MPWTLQKHYFAIRSLYFFLILTSIFQAYIFAILFLISLNTFSCG